tara:strand:- start:463 stop:765 length:303 start_codon:yes stop_codon:yes gene_type:complete
MQSSELVNRIKNKNDISTRLDDITKTLKSIKKEQEQIKNNMRKFSEKTSKQIKELYSLYQKIDSAYCSGLCSQNIIEEHDESEQFVYPTSIGPNDIFPMK